MQARTATRFAGGIGRPLRSNASAYRSALARSSSVTLMAPLPSGEVTSRRKAIHGPPRAASHAGNHARPGPVGRCAVMAIVERVESSQEAAVPPAGDACAALERLYVEHSGRVLATCASILRDRYEAEDAAQQVFVSALRALRAGT